MKKEQKKNPLKTIASARTEVIEALEELKAGNEPHTKFYEGLQARQTEIVNDLEAMVKNDEEKKITE